MNTVEDVIHLVDYKVKETLLRNYAPFEEELGEDLGGGEPESEEAPEEGMEEEEPVEKSLIRVASDDFGIATVWSDLTSRRPDEQEFSVWLHATPLHDISEEEQIEIEEQLGAQKEEAEQPEEEAGEEGAVKEPAGTAPAEGELPPTGEEVTE